MLDAGSPVQDAYLGVVVVIIVCNNALHCVYGNQSIQVGSDPRIRRFLVDYRLDRIHTIFYVSDVRCIIQSCCCYHRL